MVGQLKFLRSAQIISVYTFYNVIGELYSILPQHWKAGHTHIQKGNTTKVNVTFCMTGTNALENINDITIDTHHTKFSILPARIWQNDFIKQVLYVY